MKEIDLMKTKTELFGILKARTESDLNRESFDIWAHDMTAEVLRTKWAGKKITARIEKQIAEVLTKKEEVDSSKMFVRWSIEHGMGQLEIWGVPFHIGHNERLTMLVGYTSRPTNTDCAGAYLDRYEPEYFDYTDACHGSAARDRNKNRISLLSASSTLDGLAEQIAFELSARASREKLTDYGQPAQEIKYFARDLAEGKDKP